MQLMETKHYPVRMFSDGMGDFVKDKKKLKSQVQWIFCRFLLEKIHIFPKMHGICLEVIIDTFKPDEFHTLHGCSEKLTI